MIGKQVFNGYEDSLFLNFDSYKEFKEEIHEEWDISRITIIAGPNKAITVPCRPLEDTEIGKHRLAILTTRSTTFKL